VTRGGEPAAVGSGRVAGLHEVRRTVAVLIVEDDADIRETLAELLAGAGYAVETAGNGAEAIAQLRRVAPQLILLDLSMPVMSGQQFRSQQLADPAIAGIPTVVMSATARLEDKLVGFQISERLAKPLKLRQLLDVVRRHCGGGGAP
jgi:CheY-like chemotaxis protein